MKKTLLFTLIMFLTASFAFSQSFEMYTEGGDPIEDNSIVYAEGNPDDQEIVYHVHVKNTHASSLDVKVKRTVIQEMDGTSNLFCWDLCYPPFVDTAVNHVAIGAGESFDGFSGHYMPAGLTSTGVVMYTFYDINNVADSACVTIHYLAGTSGIADPVKENNTLSSAYPNPAASVVNFDYSLDVNAQSAEIVVVNLLGSVVMQESLNGLQGTTSINVSNLTDGIYFYSLIVNGEAILSKKMMVRH